MIKCGKEYTPEDREKWGYYVKQFTKLRDDESTNWGTTVVYVNFKTKRRYKRRPKSCRNAA